MMTSLKEYKRVRLMFTKRDELDDVFTDIKNELQRQDLIHHNSVFHIVKRVKEKMNLGKTYQYLKKLEIMADKELDEYENSLDTIYELSDIPVASGWHNYTLVDAYSKNKKELQRIASALNCAEQRSKNGEYISYARVIRITEYLLEKNKIASSWYYSRNKSSDFLDNGFVEYANKVKEKYSKLALKRISKDIGSVQIVKAICELECIERSAAYKKKPKSVDHSIVKDGYLTIDDLSKPKECGGYGLSRDVQTYIRKKQELPFYKAGNFIRYKKEDVDNYVNNLDMPVL